MDYIDSANSVRERTMIATSFDAAPTTEVMFSYIRIDPKTGWKYADAIHDGVVRKEALWQVPGETEWVAFNPDSDDPLATIHADSFKDLIIFYKKLALGR